MIETHIGIVVLASSVAENTEVLANPGSAEDPDVAVASSASGAFNMMSITSDETAVEGNQVARHGVIRSKEGSG